MSRNKRPNQGVHAPAGPNPRQMEAQMAQAKLESTSRRDLLKGATAIAALAVPATALAAAAPDPIFVAIEQERAARKAWLASFDQDGECDARLHQTAMNAAGDALRTCPTTVAGVIAAMEWTAEAEAD